jgi:hypothetical protein
MRIQQPSPFLSHGYSLTWWKAIFSYLGPSDVNKLYLSWLCHLFYRALREKLSRISYTIIESQKMNDTSHHSPLRKLRKRLSPYEFKMKTTSSSSSSSSSTMSLPTIIISKEGTYNNNKRRSKQ